MAAFVCEVVLDLAQCVWAELHFANYFSVAEFSAWRSSRSKEERLSGKCLVSPCSECEILLGLWWTVREAEPHGTEPSQGRRLGGEGRPIITHQQREGE